jgi:hypothetical protein
LNRRSFVALCAGLALWPVARLARGEDAPAATPPSGTPLPKPTLDALDASGLVYVSPLKSDGEESTCHGEVWFGWLDGAVVLITSAETWKSRALGAGLDRARVWVGDHGRAKGLLGRNEKFRAAPHFDTTVVAVKDDALLDRLLALYETKYPAEIPAWRDRMRNGYRDGSRLLLRYTPA